MNYLYIFLLAVALSVMSSCTQELTDNAEEGRGKITVHISSRSVFSEEGVWAADNELSNLTVVLANTKNIIVDLKNISPVQMGENGEVTLQLGQVKAGRYTLFALANGEPVELKVGEKINPDATFTNEISSHKKIKLLTGKTEIEVNVGENKENIELTRPFMLFSMVVFNHSAYPIKITDLDFGKFNPKTGYLFCHKGDLPQTQYDPMPKYGRTGQAQRIAPNSSQVMYQTYLYEGSNPSQYKYNMTIKVMDDKVGGERILKPSVWNTTDNFLIGNEEGYFLFADGEYLGSGFFTEGDSRKHFFWKFEEGKLGYKYYIKCPDLNTYIYMQDDGGLYMNNSYTFKPYAMDIQEGQDHSFIKNKANGFYITTVNGHHFVGNKDKNKATTWYFYRLVELTKSVKDQKLFVVDADTGKRKEMTKMLRNQHLRVQAHIYYNEKNDEFTFQVIPWQEGGGDMDFN